ncbi:hypothetical protein DAPPUDRAFT_251216 [Daphnia pulex]|uniref:YqaJ viral recombinase domain-containing protein n=1 Tax=Daphnia pulex TaxID=6669 RepID=E9GZY4_DAPPU|nr:hypothetical protein DAPPUDRAFT_251216 [Daphnia pulex]|eukprot:EFX74980.1 hypothetical protein DAPPUDRAFT_251216 [Daphnia pulex]
MVLPNMLGRVCIHVSALLQLAVAEHELPNRTTETSGNADEEQVAPTSKACEWNKPGKGPVEFEGKPDVVVNDECERIFQTMSFSKEDQEAVEISTRDQSAVSEWKKQRAGRITGTKIKRLTPGDINFILEMCYPELNNFTGNKSTIYGLKNEPIAAKLIEKHILDNNLHKNFSLKQVGFVIALSASYVGASPDRLTECDCCGRCVLEIKCPSTLEGKDIEERVKSDKSFFLQINPETQEIYLMKNHDYYFQFQLQLYVTESRKGIFGVYNGVMSKRYSSVKNTPSTEPATNIISANINRNRNQFICDCQDPLKIDEVVRCAGNFCMFQEFHKSCTKSKVFPETWKCMYCKKEDAKKKREEAKKKKEDSLAIPTNTPQVNSSTIPANISLVNSSAIQTNHPLVIQPVVHYIDPFMSYDGIHSSNGMNNGSPVAMKESNKAPPGFNKKYGKCFGHQRQTAKLCNTKGIHH